MPASKRHPRILSLAWAMALAASVALAGCGGGSGPSKSQYAAKANAVCKSTHTQAAPLIGAVTSSASGLARGASGAARLGRAVERLRDVVAAGLEKLRKLEQPSGEHATIERFLTPFAAAVSSLGEAAPALEHDDSRHAIELLEQIRTPAEQATSAARAYGLTQCAPLVATLG